MKGEISMTGGLMYHNKILIINLKLNLDNDRLYPYS